MYGSLDFMKDQLCCDLTVKVFYSENYSDILSEITKSILLFISKEIENYTVRTNKNEWLPMEENYDEI